MSQNYQGGFDELMYKEDSVIYGMIKLPPSKNDIKNINKRRGEWLEDFLYLPSHVTSNKRKDILKKYGQEALFIEKDVS